MSDPTPEREPLDLDGVIVKWLMPCGPCDASVPVECTHPGEDYRPVMAKLVDEVAALREQIDRASINAEKHGLAEILDAHQIGRLDHALTALAKYYGHHDECRCEDDNTVCSDQQDGLWRVTKDVLAALDLPGREKALRDEVERQGWELVAAEQACERLRELLSEAKAEVERLTYERRLLGFARRVLDLVADEEQHAYEATHIRTQAADIAQRIVDEIGHPVTDEEALGPGLRDENANLARAVDDLKAANDGLWAERTDLHERMRRARMTGDLSHIHGVGTEPVAAAEDGAR